MNDKTQHTQSWTPEPWEYQVQKENICVVFTNNKKIITGRISSDDCGHPQCCKIEEHANAQRIVSCVNALAGIENPAEFVAQSKAKDDRIKELEDQIEQRWIDVKQKLPAFGQGVMVHISSGVITCAYRMDEHLNGGGYSWQIFGDMTMELWVKEGDTVTNWQHLPALPTNKKEETK